MAHYWLHSHSRHSRRHWLRYHRNHHLRQDHWYRCCKHPSRRSSRQVRLSRSHQPRRNRQSIYWGSKRVCHHPHHRYHIHHHHQHTGTLSHRFRYLHHFPNIYYQGHGERHYLPGWLCHRLGSRRFQPRANRQNHIVEVSHYWTCR